MFELREFCLESSNLGEGRSVTIALPKGRQANCPLPLIFCADGQAVAFLSNSLALALGERRIPPVVLIGVHHSATHRAEEYVSGVDEARFRSHERFFTEEVVGWTNSRFAFQIDRGRCGVFGFSNGGAFATSMALRHGDKFAVAIAFSIPRSPSRANVADFKQSKIDRCYLAAGKRERAIRHNTRQIAEAVQRSGKACVYCEREAGHEAGFWAAELPTAIAWCFPADGGG